MREHDAGDRRVEGRRNAGRGAARDEELGALGGRAQQLRHRGADRAADLRDRPFAADRSAGAERDRGAERLHDHPALLHAPALEVHHLEEAREAVAERVTGKEALEGEQDDGTGGEPDRRREPCPGRGDDQRLKSPEREAPRT